MPRLVGGALALVVLVLILPGASAGPSSAGTAPHAPLGGALASTSSATGAADGPTLPTIAPAWAQNLTLSPRLAAELPASSVPISAISAVPPPRPPATTPVVMTFLTNSTTCCVSANFTAPVGIWGMVVLNYTGQAVGGVYDSSFRAYIDQVQVFFGTTPEYGIWYDTRDVTPYVSLLHGTFNFTFLLGAATTGGYFDTSVSLSFYPVPVGASPPQEPDLILPIWHRVFISTTTPSVYDVATVPSNVTNATLEMWTYGFGPDEFWYAAQPNYRQLTVNVDGQPQIGFAPFPFINTGGNDLFAWRPITGVDTLSNRPFEIPITADLGALEGTHNLTVSLSGVTSGSSWLIGGALLLYTNSSVTGATGGGVTYSATTPTISTDHHSYYDQTASTSTEVSSTITSTGGDWTVALYSNNTYTSSMALSTAWSNLSALESWSMTERTDGPAGAITEQTTFEFPLQMDLGSVFVPNAGQGSGYPIFGNVTDYFLNVHQEWDAVTSATNGSGANAQLRWSRSVDNLVTGGNNIFIATEKLISATAAELTGITFVQSATTNQFHAESVRGALTWNYNSLLVGSAYQPPAPNEVETVLVQQVSNPVDADLTLSRSTTEVGAPVSISVGVVGGTAPYSYSYTGLPASCSTANVAVLTCTPMASGTFVVAVAVTAAGAGTDSPSPTLLIVQPGVALNLTGNMTGVDAGGFEEVSPILSGGVAPFECTWSAPGNAPSTSPCQPTSFGPLDAGSYSVTVRAVDALGVTTANRTLTYVVFASPTVDLTTRGSSNVTVGSGTVWTATVDGGAAPFDFVWYVNNTIVQNSSENAFTFVPAGSGAYQLSVFVTDAAGSHANAGPSTVTASPASGSGSSGTPPGGGSSPSGPSSYLVLGAGLAVGAVLGALVGMLLFPRRPGGRAPAGPE